ncbi:MAG: hypothetical protein QXN75_02070 [Thermoproteota archaeon]|nr:hypothetical protein [Candidatus Brockarchaeota archaeon]
MGGKITIKLDMGVQPFYYKDLAKVRFKAFRNGNWRRLKVVEKAFFNASLCLAKLRGKIINPSLIKAVKTIVLKLLQVPANMIMQLAKKRASLLYRLYENNGVFKWAPHIKKWLKEPQYLFWLGVSQVNLRSYL